MLTSKNEGGEVSELLTPRCLLALFALTMHSIAIIKYKNIIIVVL